MEPVIQGLLLVLDPFNIALIFGGVVIGVIVGALPGLKSGLAADVIRQCIRHDVLVPGVGVG